MGWTRSGGEAKMAITERTVFVDDVVETRNKCKIRPGQKVAFNGKTVTVSKS